MNTFAASLGDLGGLHDAKVSKLVLDLAERSFCIDVDDIHSNFEGLPEYTGRKPGRIQLHGIGQVRISVDLNTDEFNIHEFSATETNEGAGTASIKFWPAGKIEMNFASVEFPVREFQ